jgi:deoxyribonuclease V
MEFAIEPRWEMPIAAAFALQRELAARVCLHDRPGPVTLVAGVDLALARGSEAGRGAVVVWRVTDGAVVESVAVERPLRMPYVPGLLAFREGPVVEAALRSLQTEPDLLMVDGQGIAHPRGLGIAAHLGVLLDRPALGVGKSRFYGRAADPGPAPGSRTPLLAPDGRQLGVVLRSRARSNPLYISPGQYVTPDRAADLVAACLRGYRLPEPVRLADRLSKAKG